MAKDLPTSYDYHYYPRPPIAKPDEQIHWHVWDRLVNEPCSEAFLHRKMGICPKSWIWNHQCTPCLIQAQQKWLSLIPKKNSPWETKAADPGDAWGIYTQYVPQFLHALMYQILFLVGPFVFSLAWPSSRASHENGDNGPTDLQNPTVPLSLAIGLLGTFCTWWQLFLPTTTINSPYFKDQ